MIDLEQTIIDNYNKYYNYPYIYEKENNKYKPITFGNFINGSLSATDYLIKLGLKEKKIMIISENSTKLMMLDFSITFYVGTCILLNKTWDEQDIKDSISQTKPDCLLYSKKYFNSIKNINIKKICIDDIDFCYDKHEINYKIKSINETSKILFTSGTVGRNKGVLLSLKNIFIQYNELQKYWPRDNKDITYLYLPLHHVFGEIFIFMYSLVNVHKIYLSSSISNIQKELLEVNPTYFCSVPLIYNRLLDIHKKDLHKAFGNNIRFLISGGAKLDEETLTQYKNNKLNIYQGYGLTETAAAVAITIPNNENAIITNNVDIKIIDKNSDGFGQIIIKGDCVSKGYVESNLNDLAFDNNGYFYTGDIGKINNNELILKGRIKKVLVTSNGENIDTTTIETILKKYNKDITRINLYINNDKLAAKIYTKNKNIDFNKIIEHYNSNAPKYEKIDYYEIIREIIENRINNKR